MHILVTRPKPFVYETGDVLKTQGHAVTLAPLLDVTYHPINLSPHAYDALVITSRQALLVPGMEAFQDLPLWAVGDTSAFADHKVAHTFHDVQALQACMPHDFRWLYVRGEAITQPLDAPYMDEHIGYTMTPITSWPSGVLDVWNDINAVTLMSQATARAFMAVTLPHDVCHMEALCYSQNIAEVVASYPWRKMSLILTKETSSFNNTSSRVTHN